MKIRPAHPQDTGPIAELMYSSGTELYDYIFQTKDHTAIEFINYEFHSGQGFCGHKNVTVAVNESNTVYGTGCFYDGHEYNKLVIGTLKNVFRFYPILQVLSVLRKMMHTSSVMPPPGKNELYLANFGVNPEARGQGIGSLMINHQREIAEQRGYKIFSLDVADNNPRAEALYRRLGYQQVAEKTFTVANAGIPNAKKMEIRF